MADKNMIEDPNEPTSCACNGCLMTFATVWQTAVLNNEALISEQRFKSQMPMVHAMALFLGAGAANAATEDNAQANLRAVLGEIEAAFECGRDVVENGQSLGEYQQKTLDLMRATYKDHMNCEAQDETRTVN